VRQRTKPRLAATAIAVATAVGAVLAYFFDTDRGRSRRAQTADRLAGTARKAGRPVGRTYRYVRSTLSGTVERLAHAAPTSEAWLNDETLAHKVETELFRNPSIPKGSMNVNAEHGTVVLRGVVDSQDQIDRIMLDTSAIDGVKVVRSLLRTPSQPTTTASERNRDLASPTATGGGER
jgi:hypothetical protein